MVDGRMNKITLTTDILIPSFTLVMIMAGIVGATIGINTLMKGNVINSVMKKLLINLGLFLFFPAFFIGGILFIDSLDLLLGLAIIGGVIYLYRNNKDGLVQQFKDIHQSNLDDIEEQETQLENTKI
jgi:hypothetical protein